MQDQILNENDLRMIIEFRKTVHQFPEIGFQQFHTRQRVKSILLHFGVKQQQIKELATTGLVVDLPGRAPSQGNKKCIAFRADMDALKMSEENEELPYKSKNKGIAHMCGHDGHMACLIGFVAIYMKQEIEKVPSNKVIRLLFQPSQEGPYSGAKKMIEQGCLQGVDEIYGMHNFPLIEKGQLWCKQGTILASCSAEIQITIIGTGGHGSEPEKTKESLRAGVKFYQQMLNYLDELKKQTDDQFVCNFPVFQAGERFNVISQKTVIKGCVRAFSDGIFNRILEKLKELLSQIESEGFTCKFSQLGDSTPATNNSKEESDHVIRLAKNFFGEKKVGPGGLPAQGTQDFSMYLKERPGAFFILTTGEGERMLHTCHSSHFDFNDSIINPAATFWSILANDRLCDS